MLQQMRNMYEAIYWSVDPGLYDIFLSGARESDFDAAYGRYAGGVFQPMVNFREKSTSFRANAGMLNDMSKKKAYDRWQRQHAKSLPVSQRTLTAMKYNIHGSAGVAPAVDLLIANLSGVMAHYGHYKYRQYRFQRARELERLANAVLRKVVDDSIRRFRWNMAKSKEDRLFNPGQKVVRQTLKDRRRERAAEKKRAGAEGEKRLLIVFGIGNWNGYSKSGWAVQSFLFRFLIAFFFS
jgi:hypothetical protein